MCHHYPIFSLIGFRYFYDFSNFDITFYFSLNRYQDQSLLQMEWQGLLCMNWYVSDTTILLGKLFGWKEIQPQSKVIILYLVKSFSVLAFVERSDS